ncbi:hypothetical protein HHX47_DHR1000602 [Lentinula edodes]|nr:hypothetical protein HHX47_DHR1000602 [Lentinula edodes]
MGLKGLGMLASAAKKNSVSSSRQAKLSSVIRHAKEHPVISLSTCVVLVGSNPSFTRRSVINSSRFLMPSRHSFPRSVSLTVRCGRGPLGEVGYSIGVLELVFGSMVFKSFISFGKVNNFGPWRCPNCDSLKTT